MRQLGKLYRIYHSPRDRLKEIFYLGKRNFHRHFWALSKVSFDVSVGETVGIVGRNGSGKSTLLQIISETLAPTVGMVDIRGRLAALLELGSGFSPEFSGRENVYMNGAILGLSHAEIDEKYEAIVRFADIGDFIDQPVRMYSSGMYVRLAFSIAINVDPEILVIDEALSVGDESFQRKCFAKFQELRDSGCTILLVSHDTGMLAELCDRVLLLDEGQCIASGSARHILLQYHRLTSTPEAQRSKIREEIMALDAYSAVGESIEKADCRRDQYREEINKESFYDPALVPESTTRYVSRGVDITDVLITTIDGRRVNNLVLGEDYNFIVRARFSISSSLVRFGMIIKSLGGLAVSGASTAAAHDGIAMVPAGSSASATFTFSCILLPEVYFIDCGVIGVIDDREEVLDRRGDVAMFKVQPEAGLPRIGLVNLTRTTSVVFETSPNTLVEIQPP